MQDTRLSTLRKALERAWKDGVITPDEYSLLEAIKQSLNVGDEEYAHLELQVRTNFRARLISRESEIEQLKSFFQTCLKGKGDFVLIDGEIGVGKTTLVDEFLSTAIKKGARVLSSKCFLREGLAPYFPFVCALRTYFGIDREMGDLDRYSKVKKIIEKSYPDLVGMIPVIGSFLSAGLALHRASTEVNQILEERIEVISQYKLYETIIQLLSNIAAKEPTVLVIENIHWMDEASLKLLFYLVAGGSPKKLLIICTYRPEEIMEDVDEPVSPRKLIQRLRSEGLVQEIRLHRLSKEQTHGVISNLFTKSLFKQDLLDFVYSKTKGNPLFTVEMLRMLVQDGVIEKQNDTWILKRELSEAEVPARIHDIMLRRISSLEQQYRDLLDLASVAGQQFTSDLLEQTFKLERLDLLRKLRWLEKVYKIIRSEGLRYIFDQPMIREVLYQELPEELRIEYHKMIGETLEQKYAKQLNEVVFDISHHFSQARVFAKALKYSQIAANISEEKIAYRDAILCYQIALDAIQHIGAEDAKLEKVAILEKLAYCYWRSARWDKARKVFYQIIELYADTLDLDRMSKNYRNLAHLYRDLGEWEEAENLFTKALKMAEQQGDENGKSDCHRGLGWISWRRGKYSKAIKHLNRSLKLVGYSESAKASVHIDLGLVYSDMGKFQKAVQHYKQSISLLDGKSQLLELARAYLDLGETYRAMQKDDDAILLLEKGIRICRKIHDFQILACVLTSASNIYAKRMETKKSLEYASEAAIISRRIDDRVGLAYSYKAYGTSYRFRRDWQNAISYYQKSVDLFRELRMPYYLGESYLYMALTFRDKGDLKESKNFLLKALEVYEEIGSKFRVEEIRKLLDA